MEQMYSRLFVEEHCLAPSNSNWLWCPSDPYLRRLINRLPKQASGSYDIIKIPRSEVPKDQRWLDWTVRRTNGGGHDGLLELEGRYPATGMIIGKARTIQIECYEPVSQPAQIASTVMTTPRSQMAAGGTMMSEPVLFRPGIDDDDDDDDYYDDSSMTFDDYAFGERQRQTPITLASY